MVNKDLAHEQLAAIKLSIEIGRTLQTDHPEIANSYRVGRTLSEIAEALDVQSKYKVTRMVAESSVFRALTGYNGGFNGRAYCGLIQEDERRILGREHRQKYSDISYKECLGIHKMTRQQRIESGRSGGLIAGPKNVKEKKGIHGLTPEQKREACYNATLARGQIPWSDEEKTLAYELARDKYCRREIAQGLNGYFHRGEEVRGSEATRAKIIRYRKSLENRAQSS